MRLASRAGCEPSPAQPRLESASADLHASREPQPRTHHVRPRASPEQVIDVRPFHIGEWPKHSEVATNKNSLKTQNIPDFGRNNTPALSSRTYSVFGCLVMWPTLACSGCGETLCINGCTVASNLQRDNFPIVQNVPKHSKQQGGENSDGDGDAHAAAARPPHGAPGRRRTVSSLRRFNLRVGRRCIAVESGSK